MSPNFIKWNWHRKRAGQKQIRPGSTYEELEIKPCGLGSRICDMEAITDLIYWLDFRLIFISFGKQNWYVLWDDTNQSVPSL